MIYDIVRNYFPDWGVVMYPKRPRRLMQALFQVSLLVAGGIIYPLTTAGMTWRELSSSLHSTFNENTHWDYNNMVGPALTLIIFAFLMACFKLYTIRQKKGLQRVYDEPRRQNRLDVSRLPDGQVQKRQWFRLQTRDWLKWFHFRGFSPLSESEYRQDHMVDIGGGGLSFTTEKKLDIGAVITFLLDVGSGDPLSVWGKVVRVQEKTDHEPQRYFIAIQFSQLRDTDRRRLVAWIMKGQRNAIHSARQEENPSASTTPYQL